MTAQSVLLLIIKAIRDPAGDPNSTPITASNIHSLDGNRWTKEQRLEIYNVARRAMVRGIRAALKGDVLRERLKGFEVNTTLTWSASSSIATAQQPDGYLMLVDEETGILTSGNVPLRLRDQPGKLRTGNNPELTQSASEIYIFEVGDTFKHYGSFVINGQQTTVLYLGITDLTLANITTATPIEEKFIEDDIPLLVEVATFVADGKPIQEIEKYVAEKAK